jgi:hypothetical protein
MIEEVHTVLDGKEVPNNFRRISLTARFEDILMSQLPKLIDRVLHAVRTEATITIQQYCTNAHAAAVLCITLTSSEINFIIAISVITYVICLDLFNEPSTNYRRCQRLGDGYSWTTSRMWCMS